MVAGTPTLAQHRLLTKKNGAVSFCISVCIGVLLGWVSLVSSAGAQESSGFVVKAEVRLVEVYATIYDGHGHYVDDLDRRRFMVLEDGQQQLLSRLD